MAIEVFNRVEKKYLINEYSYKSLMEFLKKYMTEDKYCKDNKFYTISNIYYDTFDNELIRRSIDKPVYKEKLRLRSYGVPRLEDLVFLEIKKKYKGIVNKRRTVIRLKEAYDFTNCGIRPHNSEYINEQVVDEITYFMDFYKTVPKLYLAYDRLAMFGKEDSNLRITFDKNIRTRRDNLHLEAGDFGNPLLEEDLWLMEIKTINSLPMWLTQKLTQLDIKGVSFSKYGTEYKNYFTHKTNAERRIIC